MIHDIGLESLLFAPLHVVCNRAGHMDALTLLKTDHQKVQSLFNQFQHESGKQQQRILFENIRHDLAIHTFIEETVFYPIFRKFKEFRDILKDSYEDHRAVKALLADLSRLKVSHPNFSNRMDDLIQNVQEHVQEEETLFFPMVRNVLSSKEREALGRHLEAAKIERDVAA